MTVELKFGGLSPEIALALLSSAAAVKASENGKAQMVLEGEIPKELPEAATAVSTPAEPEPSEEQPEARPAIATEQVRAVLAEKSRAGKTAEVKALLTKYGADKLTDVAPSEYAALMAEAEVL